MRLFEGTPFDIPPTCERCGKLEGECSCPPEQTHAEPLQPSSQTVKLSIEKRKKGKVVTVVAGLSACNLDAVLPKLKAACGAGGTRKDDLLEIQGRHLDRVRETLVQIGYNVKQ